MATDKTIYTIADHIPLWIEQTGSVHIKTCDPHGDPVELGEEEALELAALLIRLVKELRV